VTPKIISNIISSLDESGSGERDFTLLDGFDDLPEDFQKRVKEAIEQGHVNDDEWNGDIEMNRPGKVGFHARGSNKGATDKDTEPLEEDEAQPEVKPKGKRGRPARVDGPAKKAKTSEKPKEARKRGRPRKPGSSATPVKDPNAPKRGRGRPRKSADPRDAAAVVAADGQENPRPATNGDGEHQE